MLALPPPFRVRDVAAHDQSFIDALYRSTRDDLAAIASDDAFLSQLIRFQQHAQVQGMRSTFPHARHYLLERDAVAIGRLVLDTAGAKVHLVDLALCPAARGLGAGSTVLRALQGWAAQRRQPLTLSVALSNPAARRLYARLGFRVTSADAMHERMEWLVDPV